MRTLRLSVRSVALSVARLRPAYKCIIVLCAVALVLVVSRTVEFMMMMMNEQPMKPQVVSIRSLTERERRMPDPPLIMNAHKTKPQAGGTRPPADGFPPDPTPIPPSWFESVQDFFGVSGSCESPPTLVEPYTNFFWDKVERRDQAYVTYVSSREHVHSAAVLLHSVALTGSRRARAVLVTSEISQRDRNILSTLAQVIEIERVAHTHHINHPAHRDTFTKLRIWELTMFKKVVFINMDVILLRNIDDLFDVSEWSVPMDADQVRYSTGMMVCEPNLKTFDDMMAKLKTTNLRTDLPDLNFLKEYFGNYDPSALAGNNTGNSGNNTRRHARVGGTPKKKRVHIIPHWYQVDQAEFRSTDVVRSDTTAANQQSITIYDHRVRGIHYPGPDKPWLRFASRWDLFRRRFCKWSNAKEFERNPKFPWYVHCAWMRSTLRRVGADVSFDSDFGRRTGVQLEQWVFDQRREEEAWKPALSRRHQRQTVQPPPPPQRGRPPAASSSSQNTTSSDPVPTSRVSSQEE